MANKNQFFIALDLPNKREALRLVKALPEDHKFYKAGMELFFKEGPGILEELAGRGKKIFLGQERLISPDKARSPGPDFPVIGRPITSHQDSEKLLEACLRFQEALSG